MSWIVEYFVNIKIYFETIFRTISPTVAGSLFSWSITSGLGFPFNEKCVFIFIGFVSWLSLLLACVLDEDAVTKRSE